MHTNFVRCTLYYLSLKKVHLVSGTQLKYQNILCPNKVSSMGVNSCKTFSFLAKLEDVLGLWKRNRNRLKLRGNQFQSVLWPQKAAIHALERTAEISFSRCFFVYLATLNAPKYSHSCCTLIGQAVASMYNFAILHPRFSIQSKFVSIILTIQSMNEEEQISLLLLASCK